jgi:hypothetical protein
MIIGFLNIYIDLISEPITIHFVFISTDVASGASVDYMKGTHDTDLAYTFEMRDTGRYGFVLPPNQIVDSSLEFLDGLIAITDALKKQA